MFDNIDAFKWNIVSVLHRCPKERFLNMSHRILATNTHAITNLSTKLKQINQSFLSFLLLITSCRDLYTIIWEAKLVIDLLSLIDLVGGRKQFSKN